MKITKTNNVNFGLKLDTQTVQPVMDNLKSNATEKEFKTALSKITRCADDSYAIKFVKHDNNMQSMILQRNGRCVTDKIIETNKPLKKVAKEIISFVRTYIRH